MAVRIYQAGLVSHDAITIVESSHHHLSRVLRSSVGDKIILFDGKGHTVESVIKKISKHETLVFTEEIKTSELEADLNLHLIQGIGKGERMDYAIQKSVELGVSEITPMITERCNVRLNQAQLEKRANRWQQIIISACEQSGQNFMPKLNTSVTIQEYLLGKANIDQQADQIRRGRHILILSPDGESLDEITLSDQGAAFDLMVGPEGGFTISEVEHALGIGAKAWRLGPRILRTETAGVAALSILQYKKGDF